MKEDNFDELRLKDANLREAIRMEEMERPQMPTDLNARLMKRVNKEVNQRNQRKRIIWPLVAAACVAGIVAIFLTPPKTGGDEAQTKVVAQVENKPEQKPASATQEVNPKHTAQQTSTGQGTVTGTVTGTEQRKAGKRTAPVRQTTSETLMAKAETSQEQVMATTTEDNSSLLALLENRTDVKETANTVTLSERDIPITRPENLKYTQEELALMKQQANEAYLKWLELELEISKFNLNQTVQK